jgi:hypothetical protein
MFPRSLAPLVIDASRVGAPIKSARAGMATIQIERRHPPISIRAGGGPDQRSRLRRPP